MREREYWDGLEVRVSGAMADIEACRAAGMWCDGFVAQRIERDGSAARIHGRVWIGFGAGRQEAWSFELLLPADADPDGIVWADLGPGDDATNWLHVDVRERRVVVAPDGGAGDAVGAKVSAFERVPARMIEEELENVLAEQFGIDGARVTFVHRGAQVSCDPAVPDEILGRAFAAAAKRAAVRFVRGEQR